MQAQGRSRSRANRTDVYLIPLSSTERCDVGLSFDACMLAMPTSSSESGSRMLPQSEEICVVSPSPLVPTMVVFAGTFAGVLFYVVVGYLLGAYDGTAAFAFRVALLTAVYDAVLTPIVYPLVRRVTEGPRSRRVVRV